MNFNIYPTQFFNHNGQSFKTLDPILYLLYNSESSFDLSTLSLQDFNNIAFLVKKQCSLSNIPLYSLQLDNYK